MSGVTTATVIAGAGLALSAAGTAASVAGASSAQSASAASAQQSQAWQIYNNQVQAAQQSKQAGWERDIADQNVTLAQRSGDIATQAGAIDELAAKDAEARGDASASTIRTQGATAYGTQRAILAAEGTDLAGSPALVLADTEAATDTSARTEISNAAREAYGYRLKGYQEGTLGKYAADLGVASAENDVAAAQAKQDNARPGATGLTYTSTNLTPAASLLSGASTLADKWQKLQFPGTAPAASTGSGSAGDLIGPGTGYTY